MTAKDDESLARAIRVYRAYYDLSQDEFADLVELSTATVSKIERGTAHLRGTNLARVVTVLEAAEYLRDHEGELRVRRLIAQHGLEIDVALTVRATQKPKRSDHS